MGLRSGVLVVFILFTVLAHSDESTNVTNITPLETKVRAIPFDTAWTPISDSLELKLLQQNLSYLPINTPQFNDYYTRGLYFEGENGKLLGYIVYGGMFEGSYWKMAFDKDVSSTLRARILLMATPFVLDKLRKLNVEWSDYKMDVDRPGDSLRVRLDFLNNDMASQRWIIEIFGNYTDMILEDTSKGKEIKISDLKKMPATESFSGDPKERGQVIQGYHFGKVYSSNLKKMVDITKDGTVVIYDTRTGQKLGTIPPQDYGTPKIKIDSVQLVLDYGPGKKRYHYTSSDFKLLYTVDNWQAPQRPNGSLGLCKDIFSR